MSTHLRRSDLLELGRRHIDAWCGVNDIKAPIVNVRSGKPTFGVCAYYRDGQIEIWPDSCAAIGLVGRQWSYPGYVVDRTPYGVLAHELGHHVDGQHGANGGQRSHEWRPADPAALTGYCPNNNEWFAELFRLFVTNPDLFRAVRPRIADRFFGEWPVEVETRPWSGVLADSPRHLQAASNKIRKAKP